METDNPGGECVLPVGEAESEQFQTGGPEQEFPVFLAEVGEPGDFVTKRENDINGGGEQIVELGDPAGLHSNQSFFRVKILLINLNILQQIIIIMASSS